MPDDTVLEEQIGQWRGYAQAHRQLHPGDLDELEDHLRSTVGDLTAAGLTSDEAFLVAVKRMGSLNELSREFSRTHSERLWKQLVLADIATPAAEPQNRRTTVAMMTCAILAAIAIKVPALFGRDFGSDGSADFYLRNFVLFALVPVVAYVAWCRRVTIRYAAILAGLLTVGAVAINAYPFHGDNSHTFILAVLHLIIALWLVVGLAYVGGDWRNRQRWMDFIRFTGEMIIYMALIALGGGVLVGVVAGTFNAIHVNPARAIGGWIIPCGVVGALVVAAWLVEAKQSVVENMAPVLTRLFTPLFAAVLIALLIGVVANQGPGVHIDRDVLIIFNAVLVVVIGLLLYSLSARDPQAPPSLFDKVQHVLVLTALAVDAFVLIAVFGRSTDQYGFTANRTAALGQNLVLLANLAWSAVLLGRFLLGRGRFAALERWQTTYLPVYAAWSWFVVLAFPPLFHFA
jgi:hypothetical protein